MSLSRNYKQYTQRQPRKLLHNQPTNLNNTLGLLLILFDQNRNLIRMLTSRSRAGQFRVNESATAAIPPKMRTLPLIFGSTVSKTFSGTSKTQVSQQKHRIRKHL